MFEGPIPLKQFRKEGKYKICELARRFNVTPSCIQQAEKLGTSFVVNENGQFVPYIIKPFGRRSNSKKDASS